MQLCSVEYIVVGFVSYGEMSSLLICCLKIGLLCKKKKIFFFESDLLQVLGNPEENRKNFIELYKFN